MHIFDPKVHNQTLNFPINDPKLIDAINKASGGPIKAYGEYMHSYDAYSVKMALKGYKQEVINYLWNMSVLKKNYKIRTGGTAHNDVVISLDDLKFIDKSWHLGIVRVACSLLIGNRGVWKGKKYEKVPDLKMQAVIDEAICKFTLLKLLQE